MSDLLMMLRRRMAPNPFHGRRKKGKKEVSVEGANRDFYKRVQGMSTSARETVKRQLKVTSRKKETTSRPRAEKNVIAKVQVE